MSVEIPAEWQAFVNRMIGSKRFVDESDIIAEGLRLVQAKEDLAERVRDGFNSLDGGARHPASEVYSRVRARINEIAGQ